MSCVLRIFGRSLDVDKFEIESGLDGGKKTYKGQPRLITKPEGEKVPYSAFSVVVSQSDFNSFEKQMEDVKAFIDNNEDKLAHILTTPEIEKAVLDFGVNFDPNKTLFSTYLPADIVNKVSSVGVGFELSFYNKDRFE